MATVTVYTAERMKEIEDNNVVNAEIVNGRLILQRNNGTTIDAGPVADIEGFLSFGGAAGGDLAGVWPNPTIAAEKIGDSHINPADPIGRDKLVQVEAPRFVGGVGQPAFNSGWAVAVGAEPSFWLDESSEQVWLSGIAYHEGNPSANSAIFTLPVGYRPSRPISVPTVYYDNGFPVPNFLNIHPVGTVYVGGDFTGPLYTYLDSVSFRIA